MVFGAKNAGATFSEKNGQIPHSVMICCLQFKFSLNSTRSIPPILGLAVQWQWLSLSLSITFWHVMFSRPKASTKIVKPESKSPIPCPNRPQVGPSLKNPKTQFFGLGCHNNHMGHPPHPQLWSMKECSGKKVLMVKVAQNDPLDSPSQKKNDQVDSQVKDMG